VTAVSFDVSPSAGSDGADSQPAGYAVHRYASVGSTNDEAKRLADQGAADCTLVVAAEQAGGRGRYGRSWVSPRGNLYASFIYRVDVAPNDAAKIGYVAAVAVADVVGTILGGEADVLCKWPNDVLVDGQKITGILPEASINAGGRLDWIVLGIGLNVVSSPSDVSRPSTSLQQQGIGDTDLDAVLAALCKSLDFWRDCWLRDGFDPIREAWMGRTWPIGQPIRSELPERTLTGRYSGLDEAGALILATEDGRLEKIHYGEIFPLEAR